nr:transporter [Pseudomonas synxantha]
MSYAVAERWRVGVAGYQLKQISDDRIDGHRQQDSREQVVGIGPGVMYQQGKQTFFANLLRSSAGASAPAIGDRSILDAICY